MFLVELVIKLNVAAEAIRIERLPMGRLLEDAGVRAETHRSPARPVADQRAHGALSSLARGGGDFIEIPWPSGPERNSNAATSMAARPVSRSR